MAGPGRMDPACAGKILSTYKFLWLNASKTESFFSASTEQRQANLFPSWVKNSVMGYYFFPKDKLSLMVTVVNENKEDIILYTAITYDYVEGHPKGIDNVKV